MTIRLCSLLKVRHGCVNQLWLPGTENTTNCITRAVTMGESGCPIRKYSVSQIGRITRPIQFVIRLICILRITDKSGEWGKYYKYTNQYLPDLLCSAKYIFIIFGHVWHTNRTNRTSQIVRFTI